MSFSGNESALGGTIGEGVLRDASPFLKILFDLESAHVFYRRFLPHNSYPLVPINLETIALKLSHSDRNVTNLGPIVGENALKLLVI